ncbi:MAG: helix-turn-helix domain-containing protein [Eubacteriaceae bacterium]|jgi:transcriptional regulator with XRE-family HTH domain|nr:helix-turn-helix domain-containing protein [Eubacteriaceae bacterium]
MADSSTKDVRKYTQIGNRLKRIRKTDNALDQYRDSNGMLSQTAMGALLGISRQALAEYEKGKRIPKQSVIKALCDLIKCEQGYILCESGYDDDIKIRSAVELHEETGLTPYAISILTKYHAYTPVTNFVSALVSSTRFVSLISNIDDERKIMQDNNRFEKDCPKELLKELNAAFDEYSIQVQTPNENDFVIFLARYIKKSSDERIAELIETLNIYDSIDNEELQLIVGNCFDYYWLQSDQFSDIDNERRVCAYLLADYSYQYLIDRYQEKQRQFIISDSFMDIVKEYVRGSVDNGK